MHVIDAGEKVRWHELVKLKTSSSVTGFKIFTAFGFAGDNLGWKIHGSASHSKYDEKSILSNCEKQNEGNLTILSELPLRDS